LLSELVAGDWRADEAEARRIAEALLDVLDPTSAVSIARFELEMPVAFKTHS
jgi:hypothetical protein